MGVSRRYKPGFGLARVAICISRISLCSDIDCYILGQGLGVYNRVVFWINGVYMCLDDFAPCSRELVH